MNGVGLLGGRYEVRDVLGFGATAEVCDGWDTRLSRPVAIKLLRRGLSSQADVRQRFEIEARAAAALNHPNIVRVYDIGNHNETPFIVMERLPGDTLGDQIALGPLPQAQVCAALRSVLAALAVAHDAGMLHRDIKPGNLLIAPSGTVKVADFGIVKTAASVHTTTGHIVGTLAYMSPDRVSGKPASVDDDLYAVGVVGYEALTGRKPFSQEDIMPLAHAIVEGRPPPLKELRPDIDPALADVIERAMSPDPLRRFGSADAMRRALIGEEIALVSPVPAIAHGRSPRVLRSSTQELTSGERGVGGLGQTLTGAGAQSCRVRSPFGSDGTGGACLYVESVVDDAHDGAWKLQRRHPCAFPDWGDRSSSVDCADCSSLSCARCGACGSGTALANTRGRTSEATQNYTARAAASAVAAQARSGNGYGTVSRGDDNGNTNGARGAGDRKTGNGNNGNGNGNNGNGRERKSGNGKPK